MEPFQLWKHNYITIQTIILFFIIFKEYINLTAREKVLLLCFREQVYGNA